MPWRFEWTGLAWFLAISIAAIAVTAWQVQADRSVFERVLGDVNPMVAMIIAAALGVLTIGYLQGASTFSVIGPGRVGEAASVTAWAVPVLAAAAIAADLVLRYAEDTNVEMPDALRFYPAIAVFVEIMLHVLPIAVLVALLGPPTGVDPSLWRIAVPVALIEAAIQAAYAPSIGTAIFSAAHLAVFGTVQVWMFWRFGFVWMLGFRLGYYALWHVAWGVTRLQLLF